MNSVILQLASKYIRFLFWLFAIIALLRGHNLPGGGFIGGLLAALAIVYNGFAYDITIVKEKTTIMPEAYIGSGMMMILISILPGVLNNRSLMYGVWTELPLWIFGKIKLGSPFIFDIGVFLIVIGVTFLFFVAFKSKGSWKY